MKIRLLLFLLVFGTLAGAQTTIGEGIDFGDPNQEHVLRTQRGDQFVGHLHWLRNDSFGFQIVTLPDTTVFLLEEIAYVGLNGTRPEVYYPPTYDMPLNPEDDPRYELPLHQLLYSSTALPYSTKGSYKNTMLFANQGEFTPNRYFGVTVGYLIPAVAMLKVRGSLSLSDLIHIGGAWHQYFSFFDFDSPAPSHPYAILTIGQRDKYINVTYGLWMFNDDNRDPFFDQENFPLVTIGASYQFADNWRFFAEAAALFGENNSPVYPTFFISNLKRRRTIDFGLFAIPESDVGVFPAISLTYLF